MSKRGLAYIYARLMGYFWLPCPRCNRMFGGHEKGGGTDYEDPEFVSGRLGWICCPSCPGDRFVGKKELSA